MKVALLLCCYNRPAYLKKTIESLHRLTTLPDILIVVDDCSSVPTKQILYGFKLDCKQHHLYKNENFGIKDSIRRGCEFAFSHGYDVVINLDSDATVKPDFIKTLLSLKTKFPKHIISGFNCNNLENPVTGAGEGYVTRKHVNGINLCFDKSQYEKHIRPALEKDGDWDTNIQAPFIITSPSVVQHIGEESIMGHPRFDQAEDFEKSKEMKISVIHPTRNRPDQALNTCLKWIGLAKDSTRIQYILSIDDSDDSDYSDFEEAMDAHNITFERNPNKTAIEAINVGVRTATGDIFVVVSDDFDCPLFWDELLVASLRGKEDYVVKTDDGKEPWIITLPIMDRKYYERFGYIYNPQYKHMFCDTEMTHVADLLDRKIVLPITFTHLHYTTGATPQDEINVKNDSTWDQGKAVYLEGIKNNFGLTEVRGKLRCDESHVQWMLNEGVTPDMRPLLTILIPTVNGRERQFKKLVDRIHAQKKMNPDVELQFCKDNKEVSIGYKRQALLQCASGEYCVFIDDDDDIADNYLETILPILKEQKPDCVGYYEKVIDGEKEKVAIHSNRFATWGEGFGSYDFYRTPFYKVPIRTDIAMKIGFSDMRFGEDRDFADRLKASKLIQKEVFIDEMMITYNAPVGHNHEERYGITHNQ